MDYSRDWFLMSQTYSTLFSVVNKVQGNGDQFFGALTSRQLIAMMAVAHLQQDKATINNIAKKLSTTKQSAKHIITILEKKGYVSLAPNEQDKRAVNVEITEIGKQTMVDCTVGSFEFFGDVFADFTTEEMEILWSLLKKLYRYDGEEQDGFEAEVADYLDVVLTEKQVDTIEEFKQRRNNAKNNKDK